MRDIQIEGSHLTKVTGEIAMVKGGLDFVRNHLGGLCDEEDARQALARANKKLGYIQGLLYDIQFGEEE
jgi:hypothetical protein